MKVILNVVWLLVITFIQGNVDHGKRPSLTYILTMTYNVLVSYFWDKNLYRYDFILERNDKHRTFDSFEDVGAVYGDIEEDMGLPDIVQNPYYGGDLEINPINTNHSDRVNGVNENVTLTCTKNIYYEI